MTELMKELGIISPIDVWMPYGSRFEQYMEDELKSLYKRNVSDI